MQFLTTYGIHFAFAIYLIGTWLDYDTTVAGLRNGGLEKNRITVFFMSRFGKFRGLLIKTLIIDIGLGLTIYLIPVLSDDPIGHTILGGFLTAAGALQIIVANNNAKIAGSDNLLDHLRNRF